MKFNSKKGISFGIIFLAISTLLTAIMIFTLIYEGYSKSIFLLLILIVLCISLLCWIYFGTEYILSQNGQLIYRSGPLRGKIDIERITEVVIGKTLWAGIKPATSRNGLIIKYDKFNEIYISPKDGELFVKVICKMNDKIIVKGKCYRSKI